jgi:hypothetical protein
LEDELFGVHKRHKKHKTAIPHFVLSVPFVADYSLL